MDIIKSLISFFFKVAFAAILVAVVWWLVSLLFPALSFSQLKNIVLGSEVRDILPSPRKYSNFFNLKAPLVPTETTNLYVHGAVVDTYGNPLPNSSTINFNPTEFTVYTDSSGRTKIIPVDTKNNQNTVPTISETKQAPSRSLYVRNLSLYQGVGIYNGTYFIGEARNEMFDRGRFPVRIVNAEGRIIANTYASSTGVWSIPGWSKFDVRITTALPINMSCSIIFEQASPSPGSQPVRVGLPVRCN